MTMGFWLCLFWFHDWQPVRKIGWPHLGWEYLDKCERCEKRRSTMEYD